MKEFRLIVNYFPVHSKVVELKTFMETYPTVEKALEKVQSLIDQGEKISDNNYGIYEAGAIPVQEIDKSQYREKPSQPVENGLKGFWILVLGCYLSLGMIFYWISNPSIREYALCMAVGILTGYGIILFWDSHQE